MNLHSDASLRAVIDKINAAAQNSPEIQNYGKVVANYLREIAAKRESGLAEEAVMRQIFDVDILSATGQGSISLQPAYDDEGFRNRLKQLANQSLSSEKTARVAQLIAIYDDLLGRLREHCGRVPRLKLNRGLAALFPMDFTTVADVGKLQVLNRMLGGSNKDHPVQAHRNIFDRLDRLLGPVNPENLEDVARRLHLPWYIYAEAEKADDSALANESFDAKDSLAPLPAIRRRRGLLAIAGYLPTLFRYLEELQDGLSKDELYDVIRADNPKLKDASIGSVVNSVHKEFDLIKREGEKYVLSARGVNLLETEDPDELADFLLTRILGVDHLVVALRSQVHSKNELYAILQQANPGWTSNFAPGAMVSWLLGLDVLKKNDDGKLALTERGKRWAEMVTWTPESLPPPPLLETNTEITVSTGKHEPRGIQAVLDRLRSNEDASSCVFPEVSVTELHTGLWAHPRRHFAVLAGISGSGKTQLARRYGLALCEGDESRVLVVPVQPGWYEPSALLGYVNPLEQQYNSTPFLDLIQRAADDSEVPYVVILDEMNLSHPEQYLAPVLSAMETGCEIDLHQLSEADTEIPTKIRYPSNLAIIGTVNMDETTHGLSDKVLDRAYTMEFWDINVNEFPHWEREQLEDGERKRLRTLLSLASTELSPMRLHFGWRTIDDVLRFVAYGKSNGIAFDEALDCVIYAKVLPKIRGEDSSRFRSTLENLRKILGDAGLARCEAKVNEFLTDLQESGTARFWR